nr:ModD protein [uncultured Sulfurimonas sp.]
MNLLLEDIGYFDITTKGLGIQNKSATMSFAPKAEIILCGVDEVIKIMKELNIQYTLYKNDGEKVQAKELILECKADAQSLHKAWKISQNIFEYMSGIATFTSSLVQKARSVNPKINIATTRKNFPGTKELMIKSVMAGGGVVHRLGLHDSILVFEQHLNFLSTQEELESAFKKLKSEFLEKKITVEVDDFTQASYFASLGADILQCEKMDFDTLKKCVSLKEKYPYLLLSATGGVNESNIVEYAKCEVDFIVTSSPYHAKPLDIKVNINA